MTPPAVLWRSNRRLWRIGCHQSGGSDPHHHGNERRITRQRLVGGPQFGTHQTGGSIPPNYLHSFFKEKRK